MPESAFADLYHVSYPRLAAQISSYLGDPAEAEDVVQEAYLRTWQRWDAIVAYDDPAAYLRRIAWNLATSRWRRITVAARSLGRLPAPQPVPEPQPDHVAVVSALRELPDKQRRAIVLHHIADMPVDDIAAELGAPRGTVLSWLHRGRAQLSTLLDDADGLVAARPAPPVEGLRRRAKRRRRTRALALLIAALTSAAAAAALAPFFTAPMPPAIHDLTEVDWAGTAMVLPAGPDRCASGKVTVRPEKDGLGLVPGPRDGKTDPLYVDAGQVRYGDLTGDGQPEALLRVWCSVMGGEPDVWTRSGTSLLVVQLQPDRTLRGLAYVGPFGAHFHTYDIVGGQIVTQVQYEAGDTRNIDAPAHRRIYRWTGNGFAQTAGRTQPLVFLPAKTGAGSPVNFAQALDGDRVVCPARVVRHDPEQIVYQPWVHWLDLEGDGDQEGAIHVSCDGTPVVYLMTQGVSAFETRVLFVGGALEEVMPETEQVQGSTLTLSLRHVTTQAQRTVTVALNG